MTQPQCDHQFVHLETVKHEDFRGTYSTRFVRIDRFFCEKCLHVEEKKREEHSRDTPEWYKS